MLPLAKGGNGARMSRSLGDSGPAAGQPPPRPAPINRLAVYAFYDPAGKVGDFVVHKLQALKPHVARLVVVVNGHVEDAGRRRLEDCGASVHVRANEGFDIWGFRHALVELLGWDEVCRFDEVLLLNSTFYGPLYPFSELFEEMGRRDADFWGLTAFKGPVPNGFTFEGMIPFHIQSYFMAFRRRVLTNPGFRSWWERLPPLATYVDAVLKHEARFTEFLAGQGFRYALYCDPARYRVVNPSFDVLDLLVEHRCPVIKRRPFFHEPLYLELNNVELARALRLIEERSSYPLELIWRDITHAARPLDLFTNATQLEVLADDAAPAQAPDLGRTLLVAYVSAVDELQQLAAPIRNVPGEVDLIVTTSDAAVAQVLRSGLSFWGVQQPAEIRLVPESVRAPLAAMLLACRAELRSGRYALAALLHGVSVSRHTFARGRYFRSVHLDNLAGSPAIVRQVFGLFARQPWLGLVLPPALHVAHAFERVPQPAEATQWARKLGITAPLDSFAALTPPGMFWCRPHALRPLIDHDFSAEDFAAKGGPPLDEVLRRLLWPAAHTTGHTARCVVTAAHLANAYVKLEYKVAHVVAEDEAQRPVHFPKQEIRAFVRDRLRERPVATAAARSVFLTARGVYRAARALYSGAQSAQRLLGEGIE